MSLNDRQHVEAVAIIRRLHEEPYDSKAHLAAVAWLRENHPEADVYMAALHSALDREGLE